MKEASPLAASQAQAATTQRHAAPLRADRPCSDGPSHIYSRPPSRGNTAADFSSH